MTFNPDWRYKRQNCFHIEEKRLIPYAFDTERMVYGNVNLSIFTTDVCNAKCNFCVAELRHLNEGVVYQKTTIPDDEEYFARLAEVLEKVRPLNPSVSLTGGEPSLHHRLPRICHMLRRLDFRKLTITTNGSGLLNPPFTLPNLVYHKFQHLNISRAHYDAMRNSQLMVIAPNYLTEDTLREIVKQAKANGVRPRLSCILVQSGVNSLPEMKKYLAWAESLGVDNVVFRELMHYDANKVEHSRIYNFCEANRVPLTPIWEGMQADPEFTFENQVLGYYYYVEVYKWRGIDVVAECADLKEIAAAKARTNLPVVYEMVFHPNGSLNGSWREDEDILLAYDKH